MPFPHPLLEGGGALRGGGAAAGDPDPVRRGRHPGPARVRVPLRRGEGRGGRGLTGPSAAVPPGAPPPGAPLRRSAPAAAAPRAALCVALWPTHWVRDTQE
ncbi:Exonuclease SbcC [Actinacidiphila bryophytorum]|uniref:Exonuclease SbcC n=1 Tax=Actinacidiphila bryophytorum TaxID=1436133 RepID=A0A9W4E1P7_9ACTN|nr:Exonuclease SbcC [Actinacidiphila bryophytorum]